MIGPQATTYPLLPLLRRAYGLFPRERHCPLFRSIVGQSANVAAIGAHYENIGRRLSSAAAGHFVLKSAARARERDPLAVWRPRRVRVVAGTVRQARQPRAVGADRVDLPVAVAIAGEGDRVA